VEGLGTRERRGTLRKKIVRSQYPCAVMDVLMKETCVAVLPEERSRPIRFIKVLLFSASVMPAVVAGALAWTGGYGGFSEWLLAGLGLLIGQAGAD